MYAMSILTSYVLPSGFSFPGLSLQREKKYGNIKSDQLTYTFQSFSFRIIPNIIFVINLMTNLNKIK